MAVLLPGKFLYLATPHTASISTTQALAEIPGAIPSNLHELKHVAPAAYLPRGTHHSTKEEILEHNAHLFAGTEVTFSVLRNPYDLLVTWWLRQRQAMERPSGEAPTFREFVEVYDDRGPGPYLREGRIFWMDADRHLRYESLQNDLDDLLRELGLASVVLPRENVTGGKAPWRSYYDADVLRIVNGRFGDEIEAAGYERISG